MSLRILPRVIPRQSPSSAILFEMSSDADSPWLAPDFFMFSSERAHLTSEISGGSRAMRACCTAARGPSALD
jgi:hypothetical protein